MTEDYLIIAESRRHNYVIDEMSNSQTSFLEMIELCKLEALLAIAKDIRLIRENGLTCLTERVE